MKKNYLADVANLCRVDEDKLMGVSQPELVNDFILPLGVEPTGQDTRGWRLSPEFMQFMAIWGQYCINEDRLTGELLMEIAMQRLSKGAIIRTIHKDKAFEKAVAEFEIEKTDSENVKEHKRLNYAAKNEEYLAKTVHDLYAPYNPWFALPEESRKYSNWYDQPGLMEQACWNFIKENLWFCMERLNNAVWRGHAEKICVALLQHISSDGKELNGYLWSEDLVKEPLKEVYQFTETLAVRHFGVEKVARILLPTWREHKPFFKEHATEIDFKALFNGKGNEHLNYEREAKEFFGKKKRLLLKIFGRLESSVNNKVKEAMLA
jgi:hypothetical protein